MKGLLILAWFLACDPWRFQEELEAGSEPLPHCEPLDEALFPSLSFPICVHTVPGSLLNLMWMIEEVTGKNALINYAFYGCYCGWGGHGTPKDATDWCCWEHDRCYGRMEDNGCKYWTIYKHRVTRGLVTCERGSRCQMGLCNCDRKLVYCLKKNLRSYNNRYRHFPSFCCT